MTRIIVDRQVHFTVSTLIIRKEIFLQCLTPVLRQLVDSIISSVHRSLPSYLPLTFSSIALVPAIIANNMKSGEVPASHQKEPKSRTLRGETKPTIDSENPPPLQLAVVIILSYIVAALWKYSWAQSPGEK